MEKNGTLNRIVNGKNADPNEWPWLAAIVSFHHKRSSFLKEQKQAPEAGGCATGDGETWETGDTLTTQGEKGTQG